MKNTISKLNNGTEGSATDEVKWKKRSGVLLPRNLDSTSFTPFIHKQPCCLFRVLWVMPWHHDSTISVILSDIPYLSYLTKITNNWPDVQIWTLGFLCSPTLIWFIHRNAAAADYLHIAWSLETDEQERRKRMPFTLFYVCLFHLRH